ncbi:MAG: hypothetical protein RR516_00685 [Erysipelotrichaceae bacterium]
MIPFILILLSNKLFNLYMWIIVILIIHELGHILAAKIFKFKITKIKLHPYGLSANIKDLGYMNIYKELLIAIAGILMQLLFIPLLYLFNNLNIISYSYLNYLLDINYNIIMFNMLMIYPLDGGRCLQCILGLIFKYKISEILLIGLSIINIILVYNLKVLNDIAGAIVLIVLLISNILRIKELNYKLINFYMYRYINPFKGKIKINHTKDLYRNSLNLLVIRGELIREDKFLNDFFNKNNKKSSNI